MLAQRGGDSTCLPAHNGETQTGLEGLRGRRRGKSSASVFDRLYDPVTTEPFEGEALIPVDSIGKSKVGAIRGLSQCEMKA